MNGQFGKKSNPLQVIPGAGQFGKKSKVPGISIDYPKEEIEETIPDTDENSTVEEIESIEEVMKETQEEETEKPEKDTD